MKEVTGPLPDGARTNSRDSSTKRVVLSSSSSMSRASTSFESVISAAEGVEIEAWVTSFASANPGLAGPTTSGYETPDHVGTSTGAMTN